MGEAHHGRWRLQAGSRLGHGPRVYRLAGALTYNPGMLLLAVDTSTRRGSVALRGEGTLLGEVRREMDGGHSRWLLGAVDEGYQYWILHRDWGIYFDFNDVVINALGAGLGVVFLLATTDRSTLSVAPPAATLRPGSCATDHFSVPMISACGEVT